jgi:hypothetical protein
MKVSVKDFPITMDVGNKGIELDVYDASATHLGDLRIGKAKIEWCKGKTTTGHGIQVGWIDLIAWFESQKK